MIIGLTVTAWSWLSAYCEYQAATQSARFNQNDERPDPFTRCCNWPTEHPHKELGEGDDEPTTKMQIINIFLTAVIAFAAIQAWLVYRDMRNHTMDIERAYVTMSHRQPGLMIEGWGIDEETRHMRVRVRVQNSGNTPARVTRTVLHPVTVREDLPPHQPPYDEAYAEAGRVSLTKGDSFELHGSFELPLKDIRDAAKTGNESPTLCLIGYVDYIDKFNRHHRAGYARWHDGQVDDILDEGNLDDEGKPNKARYRRRNNLLFVTVAGYNYDRERLPHEGDDWNEG